MRCVDIAELVEEMMIMMSIKTYSELITIPTYKERFEYLKLGGVVGRDTFGYDRYLNQAFYNSPEWKHFRRDIIIRDNGCDLACEGYNIRGRIILHHINPITYEDLINRSSILFDQENIVCVTHNTHNAIHYGDSNLLTTGPIERTTNDTCPWK